jgi:hypothetical protein
MEDDKSDRFFSVFDTHEWFCGLYKSWQIVAICFIFGLLLHIWTR